MSSSKLILPNGFTLDHVPGAPTPEARAKMLSDCLDSMCPEFKPATDQTSIVLEKGMEVRRTVIAQIRPLLTDPRLVLDGESMGKLAHHVAALYANEFAKLPYEDLVWLVTVWHSEMLMRKVKEQVGL